MFYRDTEYRTTLLRVFSRTGFPGNELADVLAPPDVGFNQEQWSSKATTEQDEILIEAIIQEHFLLILFLPQAAKKSGFLPPPLNALMSSSAPLLMICPP